MPGLEPPDAEQLTMYSVNVKRLPEFEGDPCVLPEYANSEYCRLREPGERPAEFNQRRLEEDGLAIDITRGQQGAGINWPSGWPLLIGLGALALILATRKTD